VSLLVAQMPREVADAFHEAGLFRMMLPRDMGGGEVAIPDSHCLHRSLEHFMRSWFVR